MELTGVLLAIGMLFTGTMNTIATSLQDRISSKGRNGESEDFEHPYFQTYTMFIGESLCFFAFLVLKYRKKKELEEKPDEQREESSLSSSTDSSRKYPLFLYFLPPTACDLSATTLMNIGLLYTTVSVYQMLRGAMVFFTALFSIIFLGKRLNFQHFLGLFLVVLGITVVGLANLLYSSSDSAKNPFLGDILVLIAQLVVATQFVVEEKVLGKMEVPALMAVGFEGFWGVILLSTILPCMYLIKINGDRIEDSYDAMVQVYHSPELFLAIMWSVFSIAFFNFFGISVTKYLSATHRTTIDSCRTLFVWIVSMAIGWEDFIPLQLVGFVLLVMGTFLYNKVINLPESVIEYLKTVLPDSCFPEPPQEDEERVSLVDSNGSIDDSVVERPQIKRRTLHEQRMRYYQSLHLNIPPPELRLVDIPLVEYRSTSGKLGIN